MNEISIKLQGGLGNYMFQIACAHAYSLKYNKEIFFTANDSVLVHKNINIYKSNIFQNINLLDSKKMSGKILIYNEPYFHYSEIPFIEENIYLTGYFQSEKYFDGYKDDIKRLFFQSPHIFDTHEIDTSKNNTCSIHVRRGDYLNSPNHHPTQNIDFYKKAIKKMPKDSIFLIFSDDMDWCKKNFSNISENFKYIEGNTDYEDILLMSQCTNNIICNSTFSWWGAWLNNNINKIIVAPKKWFGYAYNNHNTKDLYPKNWILI